MASSCRTAAIIGRFYNGRDHSTVCYGNQRIEALRESDPLVDALLTDLKRQLTREDNAASASAASDEHYCPTGRSQADLENFAELIAARVCAYKARTVQTYE